MADTTDIIQSLKRLGLDTSEAAVYKELLLNDAMTITELSESSNIPRTTIYRACDDLAEKSFIEWVIGARGKKVKAVKSEMLDRIVQDKRDELRATKEALRNLQKILKVTKKNLPITQVRYYKGKGGMKQLIWNTLKAKKEIVGYSVYGRREVVGQSFIKKYVLEFRKRKLIDKVIINKKIAPKALEMLKDVHQQTKEDLRVIPEKGFYISGDTYIYNNVYAVNFWKGGEIIGVEIENPEIVKVQKSIFDTLWRIAKPLSGYRRQASRELC